MARYRRHSYRNGRDPSRRLLAAMVVRTVRDLSSPSPRLRDLAIEFFDDEGIAWAGAFGIPEQKVRQKLAEVING